MTPHHHWQPHGLDHEAQRRLVADARRAGITQFQVLALVHRRGARERILLVDDQANYIWAVPVALVHPGESIADTLDWLCSIHLGLHGWDPAFATTTVCQLHNHTEVLQVAFDVTTATDVSWPGRYYWWHTHTEPPALHRLSRPILEQLFGIRPEA